MDEGSRGAESNWIRAHTKRVSKEEMQEKEDEEVGGGNSVKKRMLVDLVVDDTVGCITFISQTKQQQQRNAPCEESCCRFP